MSYYNIEIEKSVIAALLNIDGAFDHIAEKIEESDFMAGRHQLLYRGIKQLHAEGMPHDIVMLSDWIDTKNLSKDTGGASYLAEVSGMPVIGLDSTIAYAERIRELAKYRAADLILVEGREQLKNADLRLDDKANAVVESLTKVIADKKVSAGARQVGSMMQAFFDNLGAACKGEILPFKPTGFEELDNQSPVQNGDLVIIGGRPSMGKTTLAQTIVQNMVEHDTYTDAQGNFKRRAGVFFSIEMTDESVMQRFMSAKAGVELGKIRSGLGVTTEDWQNLMQASANYQDNYPMFVESETDMTIHQMRTTLNMIRAKHGEIGVIMIDYIQIMGGATGKDAGQKAAAIGDIAKALKGFAKEYNCPVIALSQLNRSLESRPNKRPIMSDLKESGAIEEAADVIMFLYRDEVYNPKTDAHGIAEVGIAKNRQGKIGTVRLAFEGQYSRFSNLMPHYQADEIPPYGESA